MATRRGLTALAAGFLLLVAASTAAAHGDLKSSVPRDKSQVNQLPRELRLTFTEAPELALTRVTLLGPGRVPVSLGKLTVTGADNATVIAPISGALAAGTYTVEWEITGDDGHPVDGAFTFTVTAEAIVGGQSQLNPSAPTGEAADPSMMHHDTTMMPVAADRFDAGSFGYVVIRFVLYTALLVVIGAVVFETVVLTLVRRNPAAHPSFAADAAARAGTVGWLAAWVLLGACVARVGAQSLALNGAGEMLDAERLGTLIGSTRWGRSWLVQLAATAAALYGFHLARRRFDKPSDLRLGWAIAVPSAVVLAFTPAFVSHAASTPRFGVLPVVLDGLHVLGAAGWLGSLSVVLSAGIPAALALDEERRGEAVADLINAFSPTALLFAGMVALSGLFAAWTHLGGIEALWEARYGKLLLAKLLVLSVVALTGAYNWLRVKPALGSMEGAGRIRRSASVEVAVAVIVLLITAVLVATPTPMDM